MQHPNKILRDFKRLHRFYEDGEVFTAFDTETTDISPSTGRIMEIGAIKFNKNGVIGEFSKLINPERLIPPFITSLTHITQDMVKDCPVMKDVLPAFLDFISDSILIAHNAQFDLNFLNAECEWANLPLTKNRCIDTLQYSRWTVPNVEKHKLDFLADTFKINKGSSHRAFDDARVCMELYKLFCKMNQDI